MHVAASVTENKITRIVRAAFGSSDQMLDGLFSILHRPRTQPALFAIAGEKLRHHAPLPLSVSIPTHQTDRWSAICVSLCRFDQRASARLYS
jgi:hypothetical protein